MTNTDNSIINATEQSDIDNNKAVAVLAYLLFFIPLLAAKESKFARYHANQGLLLLLAVLIIHFVGAILPFIGWLIIIPIGVLGVLAVAVIGVLHAVRGRMEPMPLIGNLKLIQGSFPNK
ncbi:hypothetical protein PAECIP111893_00724 [Paenibacillus plantiphilus]|uniref:DUF4870 domain-containing protein n=1 Tax=Paenibacillus plantiphilus TaxID=2905650 RepID=A0ABN8FZT0_9BACL|nr:hypothetical protein [Paenibacillus plantiphilus]CAH1195593.1 hypothetical protein PAECIP111893_00724 [Paenibacillus plantiphilus]